MRVYGMNFHDTMGLPIRAFWQISGMVSRLLAFEQGDKLEFNVLATHDPKAASEALKALRESNAEPIIFEHQHRALEERRDETGFNELRAMLGSN